MAGGYKRPRYPNFSNYTMPGFKHVLYSAGNVAKRLKFNYTPSKTMTMTSRKINQGVTTTGQHDYSKQYQKRRAPYKIRRAAKKAYRRFIRQSLKLVGTNTVVKNNSVSVSTSATDTQNWTIVHLGGTNGVSAGEPGVGDINSIVSSDTRISSSGKMCISNASIDITMRNTSSLGTPAEVDVYEVGYWDTTKTGSFSGLLNDVLTNTPAIGTLTSLTLVQRGVQLFDLPGLAKSGITIFKKTKVFLPNGNTATYRMSVRKPTWINPQNDIIDNSGFVKRKFTRSLLFVVKPTVGAELVTTLTVGATRKYVYKIFEDDRDADGLLP